MSTQPTATSTAPPRRGLTTHLVIRASPGTGATRFISSGGGFPLTARRTGRHRVHLVSTGAWPLGGDDVRVSIVVDAGAWLEVSSVSATLVLPGRHDDLARVRTDLVIGRGATLLYDPGPTIVASGARVLSATTIDVEDDGQALLRDLLVLGRHGEPGGHVTTRIDVQVAGRVLLRESIHRPDPCTSTVVDRGAKAVGGVLGIAVEPPDPLPAPARVATDTQATRPARAAVLELPGQRGWRATALAEHPAAAQVAVDQWWQNTSDRARLDARITAG